MELNFQAMELATNTPDRREGACEALLFAHGAPIALPKLAKLVGVAPAECVRLVDALAARLAASPERGLTVVRDGEEITLATKPEWRPILEALMKQEFHETLTPATLETLSLVAYLGPVPRVSIDYIRGVNSSFTLRNLLVRGLIERTPAPKGGGYVYRASVEFLKHMGLARAEALPEYEKYREFYDRFMNTAVQSEATNAPEPAAP